jgi:hypothetical protein
MNAEMTTLKPKNRFFVLLDIYNFTYSYGLTHQCGRPSQDQS